MISFVNKANQLNELINKFNEQRNTKKNKTNEYNKSLMNDNKVYNSDPFQGYNCPKFTLIFQTPKGNKIVLNAPVEAKVREVLLQYIQRVGLGPNLISNGIYFICNGAKLTKENENEKVKDVFFGDNTNIVVIDQRNLIGN